MRKLLLFLFGSIEFCAKGGFGERFLNLCNVYGVRLHALHSREGVLYAATSLASFRKIRKCAVKSGMRIKITRKRGLPFLYARVARRNGLFLGVAAVVFALFFYSHSIWRIDISGNQSVKSVQILQVLRENGVHEGSLKKDIPLKSLGYILSGQIDRIAWVNVSMDGSRLVITLRETVERVAQQEDKTPCNIVASRGGVVDTLRVYEGQQLVHEGDGVSEGQLLVSGVVEYEQAKKNTFHRARAECFAYTSVKKRFAVPKQFVKTSDTGREKTVRVLQLFRVRIPLYIFRVHYAHSEVSVLKKPLVLGGRQVPIAVYVYRIREQHREQSVLSRREAQVFARGQQRAFERSLKEGTKIERCTVQVSEEKRQYVFTYTYALYEDIAKAAAIEIESKNVNNSMEKSE